VDVRAPTEGARSVLPRRAERGGGPRRRESGTGPPLVVCADPGDTVGDLRRRPEGGWPRLSSDTRAVFENKYNSWGAPESCATSC
jgi:hypothetical protein